MEEPIKVEAEDLERFREKLREKQNLLMGFIGGVFAAAGGAVVWAAFTYWTQRNYGLIALAVGAAVGFAVLKLGRGVDLIFRIMGAALALLGCAVGNVLVVCAILARQDGLSIFGVVSALTPSAAIKLLQATFEPLDLIFYGIAVYEGYKLSAIKLTAADYYRLSQRS